MIKRYVLSALFVPMLLLIACGGKNKASPSGADVQSAASMDMSDQGRAAYTAARSKGTMEAYTNFLIQYPHAEKSRREAAISRMFSPLNQAGGQRISDISDSMSDAQSGVYRGHMGCIDGNCTDGEGTFIFPDRRKYVGAFKGGNPHGQGKMVWFGGSSLTGKWSNGNYPTKGQLIYGTAYEALTARMQWPSDHPSSALQDRPLDAYIGHMYVGELNGLFPGGKGTYYGFDKGSSALNFVKRGDFIEGRFEGKGEIINQSGSIRMGSFVAGQLEGKGEYSWISGKKYIGNFVNGLQEGKGKVYSSDGRLAFEGKFLRGDRVDFKPEPEDGRHRFKFGGLSKFQYIGDGNTGAISDIDTVRIIKTSNGMTQSYTDMDISNQTAISPDGKVLAALKLDGILTTYNLKTGKKIKEFPKIPDFSNDFPGTFGKAKAMVYSPKGKSVGICGFKNNVYLLNTTNGNSRILADKFPCDTLNFSPDGSRLITGSEKGNISLFEVKSGKVLHSIKISGKLKQVGFNAKGNRVFATSKNKLDNVIIWGSKKFKERSRIQVCDAVALGIDASLSQAVFICDTELSHYAIKSGTQTLLRNAYRHNYLTNKEVIFSPNGDQFMVGSYFTKELRFFNVGKELENPKL